MNFIWTPDKVRLLKRLSSTHTKKEAASVIGCSFNSIKKKAWYEGVEFKKIGANHSSSKTSAEDVEKIRSMRDEGFTFARIAEVMKMKIGRVYYYADYRSAV